MDLNEMRDQVRKVKAPGAVGATDIGFPFEALVATLRAEAAKDSRRLRRSMIFFVTAGFFYVSLFTLTWIAPPDDTPGQHRVVLSAFGLLFLTLGIYSRMKSRELAGVAYTKPARAFLSEAAERYRFLRAKDLLLIIPYLAILTITCTLALLTGMKRYLPGVEPEIWLFMCSLFFPAAWAVGLVLGWRAWKKRREPLLKQIRMTLSSLAADAGAE